MARPRKYAVESRAQESGREAESRQSNARRKTWVRPSNLEAPKPQNGFHFRWIRIETRGQTDSTNISKRFREGYVPVKADEFPQDNFPQIEDGKYAGCIGVGGQLLCKIDEDIVKDRNRQIQAMTNSSTAEKEAEFENAMTDPDMPVESNRQAHTTVGNGRPAPSNAEFD